MRYEAIETMPYEIVMTDAIRRQLERIEPVRQELWLSELRACGAWWLWEIKHRKPGRKMAHFGRKWTPESGKIGFCCNMVYFEEDLSEVHPSHQEIRICGTCARVAARHGIEIGNYQPRLK